jgi:hypothetical protein
MNQPLNQPFVVQALQEPRQSIAAVQEGSGQHSSCKDIQVMLPGQTITGQLKQFLETNTGT